MSSTVRHAAIPLIVARDAGRLAGRRYARPTPRRDALEAAIDWLCLTHDVTGRRGSSKGYSLLHGWLPAFPETTGYIIGTLLEHADKTGDDSLRVRAREMGDWEVEVQDPDGGVMEGPSSRRPGQLDRLQHGHGHPRLARPARALRRRPLARGRAAGPAASSCASSTTTAPGSGEPTSLRIRTPTTRASTGRCSGCSRRPATSSSGTRGRPQLDWVVDASGRTAGSTCCIFKPRTRPEHATALAYTMRGLLESAVLLGDERYLDAARRARPGPDAASSRARGASRRRTTSDWSRPRVTGCLTGHRAARRRLAAALRDHRRHAPSSTRARGGRAGRPRSQSRLELAGDRRRAAGLVPGLRALRAAAVSELGDEVPGRLARPARTGVQRRRREGRARHPLSARRHARLEARRGRRPARRRLRRRVRLQPARRWSTRPAPACASSGRPAPIQALPRACVRPAAAARRPPPAARPTSSAGSCGPGARAWCRRRESGTRPAWRA